MYTKIYQIANFLGRYYACRPLIHTTRIVKMQELYWFCWGSAEGSPNV
jgi:hypothetical protein